MQYLSSYLSREVKKDKSTGHILKTRQLTPKQPRLINSSTGKRRNVCCCIVSLFLLYLGSFSNVLCKLLGGLQRTALHVMFCFIYIQSLLAPVAIGCCNDENSPQGSVIIIVSSCACEANKVILIH